MKCGSSQNNYKHPICQVIIAATMAAYCGKNESISSATYSLFRLLEFSNNELAEELIGPLDGPCSPDQDILKSQYSFFNSAFELKRYFYPNADGCDFPPMDVTYQFNFEVQVSDDLIGIQFIDFSLFDANNQGFNGTALIVQCREQQRVHDQ